MKNYQFIRTASLCSLFALGAINPLTASVYKSNVVETVQQNSQCTGLVTDKAGEPIIGASVLVKGTTNGVITNLDGRFNLQHVKKGDILVISYVGYQNKEIKWNGTPLKVVLEDDNKVLDEVVVVGYGAQKKANLTGSVSSIDSKELQNRPIQNVSSGLQGLMPGVTVTGTNGAPGMDGGQIRVRGIGTLNNASPYILIDGVESSNMNSLDPNDIASISVLKDAASAAIYGSKAANGVILITTKRGKSGKPTVSYSGYFSVQNTTKMVERVNSYENGLLLNEALKIEGKAPKYTEDELKKFKDGSDPLNYPNTDWYDLAYKTGVQHRHNVNVSGGNEAVRYMGSLGYLHQTGVLPNASREQFNARTNLDMQINSRLSTRLNMAYIKNQYADPSSAYYGGSSDQILRQLNLISPAIVARYPDGTWGTIADGSPIAWLDEGLVVDRDNYNFAGTASIDYKILDGLTLTLTGSYVNNMQHYKYFQKFFAYNPNKKTDPNQLDERVYNWNRTNYDALLNYDKSFGKHHIKALAGWHTEKFNNFFLKGYRKNFPNNELTDMNAGDKSTQQNEGDSRALSMLSWFGRFNYDFAGKYLFEANLRADASSRFAEGHRWGYFPSFSAAWRLTEESFMSGTRSWLNNLKLRASWGILGNQDALDDYYPALNTYTLGKNYPINGNLTSGAAQTKYRLSTISWEKSNNWGVGVDFALLENKITGTIDYYNRKTTGILMDVSAPSEFALGAYKDNVGALRNSGVEITLGYHNQWGNWTFSALGNFSYNHNEILDLGGVDYMNKPYGYSQRYAIGHPMNSYYIYKANGFLNSDEEAAEYQKKYNKPFGKEYKAGDIRYADVNNDGKINGDDRIYANSTEPVYTFGLNLSAGWKGFDLSVIFNGAAKVSRLFDGYEVFGVPSSSDSHPATIWLDHWRPDNKEAKMPRLFTGNNSPSSSRTVASDFWLQNTSYIRLKNLQLGYTLPKTLVSNWKLQNVRLYYSVENLFTIDNMKINIDPEATSQRLSSYPLLRTHALGLNISF